MSQLIEVVWRDNINLYFEANINSREGVRREAGFIEDTVKKSKEYLDKSFQQIGAFSEGLITKIKETDLAPDEVEVEFGVKFMTDAGVAFVSAGTEAGITVKVKWERIKEK